MNKYVYISNGKVVAILKYEANIEGIDYDLIVPVLLDQNVNINDSYDGKAFYNDKNLPSFCLTKLEFLNRFTLNEIIQIENSTDNIVKAMFRKLNVAEFIDLYNPEVIQGINYLVQIGILTPERAQEILG